MKTYRECVKNRMPYDLPPSLSLIWNSYSVPSLLSLTFKPAFNNPSIISFCFAILSH